MERYLQRGEASVQLPAVRPTAPGAQLIRVENAQEWIASRKKRIIILVPCFEGNCSYRPSR